MLRSVLGVSKLRGSSALTSCFCERGSRGGGSYALRFTHLWSSVLVPVVLKISVIERSPLTILSYWSKGLECVAPCSCWDPACRRYLLPSPLRKSSRSCRRYPLPGPLRKSSRSPSVFGYCVPWMWRTVEALQLYCLGLDLRWNISPDM